MREALEEARAYTAIHEVKVSKGRQTLDISKDDLPVYKAKGWKLAEELVTEFKRMTVRIRDKNKMNKAMKDLDRLSAKQNLGLSVLDKGMYQVIQVVGNDRDLNNIAKDLKNFYGAEIKAESVEESTVELSKLLLKKGEGERGKGPGLTPAEEKRLAELEQDALNKFKNEELEERFTIGDYKRLEADNRHDIAAKKLVDKFGTPEDKKEIDAINKRHNKTGYITGPDFKKRTQIVNKYFSKLMP